ncbi:hypothetical protein VNO77_03380 [Canavalia gladiata]|uniref:Uncharacterized protein n=1 Tax=Canavalia gladiata TaxID=3824 RepID=A0AAN9MUL9_CANGL
MTESTNGIRLEPFSFENQCTIGYQITLLRPERSSSVHCDIGLLFCTKLNDLVDIQFKQTLEIDHIQIFLSFLSTDDRDSRKGDSSVQAKSSELSLLSELVVATGRGGGISDARPLSATLCSRRESTEDGLSTKVLESLLTERSRGVSIFSSEPNIQKTQPLLWV